LLLVAAIVTVGVFNFDKIKSAISTASEGLGEALAIRAELQARYNTPNISVMLQHHSGTPLKTLAVTFVNSPAFEVEDDEVKKVALDMARFVKSRLRDPSQYMDIEIRVSDKRGSGLSWSKTARFRFSIDTLDPLEEDAASAEEATR